MLFSTYDRLYPGTVEIFLELNCQQGGFNICYRFPDNQIYNVWFPFRNTVISSYL